MVSCKNSPKGEKAVTSDAAVVKDNKAATADAKGATYTISPGSTITWNGTKIGGEHTGTINVTKGSFSMDNGMISNGTFTIDMSSLNNTDLEGEMKGKLEGHLKSADFFDVATYPTSKFELIKAVKLANDPAVTHLVSGNLTMKDATKQVSFKVKINEAGNTAIITSPDFVLDRTDFNVKYGSNKFFDDLKDKAISDEIGLKLNLKASK